MRSLMMGAIASGCLSPVSIDQPEISPEAPTSEDTAETVVVVPEDAVESIEGDSPGSSGTDGDWLFDGAVVHEVALTIDDESWTALQWAPREYAPATFTIGDTELLVGIRLKGNTTFRTIDDKPALVVDFNREVEEQELDGLPSVYLHNLTYDPSMMHEHHAYWFFRTVGVPASRTAYANLTVNGQNYGLYLFVEKQNRVDRKRWWTDPDGSMFESGSFNWPCDVSMNCSCFEADEVAEGGLEALEAMCNAVRDSGLAGAQAHLDWDRFIDAMAAEMVVSHYDNYGWNLNNFRIYHDPTDDVWGFSPWSTDLSFGWYPWSSSPHCGEFAQSPRDYNEGYLIRACWSDADCTASLEAAVQEHTKTFQAMDMPGLIAQTHAMIAPYIAADTRRWYNDAWVEQEVACMISWSESRPSVLLE